MRLPALLLSTLFLAACGGNKPAETTPQRLPSVPALSLNTTVLSGEKIAVLPLTLVVRDVAMEADSLLRNEAAAAAWADSIIGAALTERGREVDWVLPAELRRVSRRAPSLHVDPDRMGQSIMGNPKLESMPEPLRAHARSLMALVGGRYVFVPAAVAFVRMPDGTVRAELSAVLGDTRNGKVDWRTLVMANRATPAEALSAALEILVPPLTIR